MGQKLRRKGACNGHFAMFSDGMNEWIEAVENGGYLDIQVRAGEIYRCTVPLSSTLTVDARGSDVLVSLFAAWCDMLPCQAERPETRFLNARIFEPGQSLL